MARLRAVVVIHAPGLGGRPDSGQRRRAVTNASWTASSARSMSPRRRIRVATQRPYSSRNTRAISSAPLTRLVGAVVLERAHLDRALARLRALSREGQRRVE